MVVGLCKTSISRNVLNITCCKNNFWKQNFWMAQAEQAKIKVISNNEDDFK